ncbi:cupredoxin domain-containing protein [Roseovarius pelagicus]|uniref:Plastocyanin/azurin family copper-binding protein n=1 Tax=Roseovarius pelagicus TaxID=2980108 RepID=A0ABY6DGL3_9RHOB|nr:plastocyanin/azurin family copper-binding protein [Roseovarius pelagicus]UXX85264.1 plastocyanin/azurin family copper-binding protein [Roseovarius pelagicus]
MKPTTIITATILTLSFATQSTAGAGHGDGTSIGMPGSAENVDRVIEVSMDEMKFEPSRISVEEGETIKFVVSNDGNLVHEFNLGTPETWKGHKGEMMKMLKTGMMTMKKVNHAKMMDAGMMHDDASSVLLEPGQTAEVIWTFSETTEMGFACNVPGHREAGMVGDVKFQGH